MIGMVEDELRLRQRIERTETVDIVEGDLIEGLSSALRSTPDRAHKVFILTGEGKHRFAQLTDRETAMEAGGVIIPAMSFVGSDGRVSESVRRTFMIGDEPATLEAEVQLA